MTTRSHFTSTKSIFFPTVYNFWFLTRQSLYQENAVFFANLSVVLCCLLLNIQRHIKIDEIYHCTCEIVAQIRELIVIQFMKDENKTCNEVFFVDPFCYL